MFGVAKQGTWWVRSKSDPRWNATGRGAGLVTTGGPPELKAWLEKCRAEYGEAPEDAEFGFMKD